METAVTPAPVNGERFRAVLGSYPTGVAVVTSKDGEGRPIGMVVGTFTSVSLDPPLIAFLPMKSSKTFERMRHAPSFCVNILAADQEAACRQLASPVEDKFAGLAWRPSPAGNPVIDGVVAWIDCEFANVVEGGDHYIVLGAVTDMSLQRDTTPLLFFQRGYGRFTTGPLVVASERETIRWVGLAEKAREDIEAIAAELQVECSVLASVGSDTVYVAVANHSAQHRGGSRLGFRVPVTPPLGTLFVGAAGSPTEEQWLARLGRAEPATLERARAQLARVRRRGWSIALCGSPDRRDLEQGVELYSNPHRTPEQERQFLALVTAMSALHEPEVINEEAVHDVLHLSVPVRDAEGQVLLVLRLAELPRELSGHRIREWLQRLQAVAARVEARIAQGRQERPVR